MAYPRPTREKIIEAETRYENDDSSCLIDKALTPLFLQYPENTDPAGVVLKVAALNSLYSTNIYAVVKVAKNIIAHNVDQLIGCGDPRAVETIGRIQIGDNGRYNYSFASKYCWWHNHDAYPIYDSYVDSSLWHYMKLYKFSEHHRRQDLYSYQKFKEIVSDFQRLFELEEFTLKQIDKFLYYAPEIPE